MAEVQKMTLVSQSLVHAGHSVNIISNWTMFKETDYPGFQKQGNIKGIDYVYTCDSAFQAKGAFGRKWQRFRGVIKEFFYLAKLKREKKIDFAILSTHSIRTLTYYVLVSKLFGFKTILNYVEFYSGIKKRNADTIVQINDYLYDKFGPKMVDANFPISEFLIEHLNKISPAKKYLKIPVLTDYHKYDGIVHKNEAPYFLYCGAALYKDVVKFVIDAYSSLSDPRFRLHLVVSGSQENMDILKAHMAQSKYPERIKLFSRLPEKDLFEQYKNAAALLIPLRPEFQDIARFPHKIGEYLASGNPVISSNYGEVKFYFTDHENMLIAENYDVKEFAEEMQFVMDNPEKARKIGEAGYQFGKRHFDYVLYGNMIGAFLEGLA